MEDKAANIRVGVDVGGEAPDLASHKFGSAVAQPYQGRIPTR
jgi:hypothetical protein